MARAKRSRDLFTASQIAKYCQVDLKTIHNWADRGEITHFRTPGRHLRFRRPDVLDFLRKYGYPIPEDLSDGRPRVVVLVGDDDVRADAATTLGGSFEVTSFDSATDALLHIGEQPPDAVVLDLPTERPGNAELVRALKRNAKTQHVRAVVLNGGSTSGALDAGASATVSPADANGLLDTLEALLGVPR